MTPSVNTLALVTLMRNAIWRERVDICYQFTQTLKNKINAIEHFLYVESFRDEQKICLNLVLRGQDVYAILPAGSG